MLIVSILSVIDNSIESERIFFKFLLFLLKNLSTAYRNNPVMLL